MTLSGVLVEYEAWFQMCGGRQGFPTGTLDASGHASTTFRYADLHLGPF